MKFIKMHGLGNDFMVVDAVSQSIELTSDQIVALARRDSGIGFDQCLLVEKSPRPGIDFFYRIFNADGQEVGQCGNGARCLARFIHFVGLSQKKELTVATRTTEMVLRCNADETVTVNMGKPLFEQGPFTLFLDSSALASVYSLNIGNPHAVSLVEDIKTADVEVTGERLAKHPHFPEGANAGFMQIVSPNRLKVRVYERGCGETKACGSGAVAAALVGRQFFSMAEKIVVELALGELIIEWQGNASPVYLTGPATFVYEGRLF